MKYCSFGIKQQALNHYKNVFILQEKIDKVLQLIQNADPTGETQPDTQEMLQLEGKELFRGSFFWFFLVTVPTIHILQIVSTGSNKPESSVKQTLFKLQSSLS